MANLPCGHDGGAVDGRDDAAILMRILALREMHTRSKFWPCVTTKLIERYMIRIAMAHEM